ncbi:hypothetical protein A6U86_26780 [Rhizobium sp. AC27/96]|uniref:hypothetical protein n=1 Tax=Rhizobium TaxID=379 RepID=UPI00082863AF|nr:MULTISPECIES: hypothetical protein [Rhizobium]OCJ09451.1 hypothetical protein A6U86_26780 [Rhizobium sp. AC27/96]
MSKMMILGVKGETGLWLVDFAAGTVTAIDGNREAYIADATSESAAEVAIAVEPREAAFSGLLYKTPQLDVAVAVEPKEQAFSGLYYKTPPMGLRAQ